MLSHKEKMLRIFYFAKGFLSRRREGAFWRREEARKGKCCSFYNLAVFNNFQQQITNCEIQTAKNR
jgi:hypothetical protein